MKKVILVILILITTTLIFAEIPKPVFVISPTTGVFSGIRVGFGVANIQENHVWEMTLNYKNELISHVAGPEITFKSFNSGYFDSIYLQANTFWNPDRKNSFLIFKIGVFMFPSLNGLMDGGIFPIVSFGYGYSFILKNKFYLRPSIDIGLQSNIINVGLAITF